jgi:hypothetical protein
VAGLDDVENIHFDRAGQQLQRALELDPKFGLARVIHGIFAPGLSAQQRTQEIDRGVADAASASTGELMLALAYRAGDANRPEERTLLLDAAAGLHYG